VPRTPRISGEELIAALLRSHFTVLRQEGSHVRLRGSTGELVTIPKTKETLKPKTLASALRQAVSQLKSYGGFFEGVLSSRDVIFSGSRATAHRS